MSSTATTAASRWLTRLGLAPPLEEGAQPIPLERPRERSSTCARRVRDHLPRPYKQRSGSGDLEDDRVPSDAEASDQVGQGPEVTRSPLHDRELDALGSAMV